MDTVSSSERSRIMSLVRGKNTQPELIVRRLIHRLGYRYRLHARDLPGSPDLVFPSRHAVIFVHGCFWHRHSCPNGRRLPSTRRTWWAEKLTHNQARDMRQNRKLRRMGWRVMIVWECQIRDHERLALRVKAFLR